MKKTPVLVSLLAAGCAVAQMESKDTGIYWQSDPANFQKADSPEKGWVLKDLSEEVLGSSIRLREVGDGTEGTMSRAIKYAPAAKFIQVKAGIAETADNTFFLSTNGGRYKIFTGWNTFPVNDKDVKDGLLSITILQTGTPGKNPGGWADLEKIRVVERPLDGLLISLLDNGRKDNTARVGDSVKFEYFPSSSILEKELDVDCFALPEMADYRFSGKPVVLNDKGLDGDGKAGDGVLSCVVKIDGDAFAFSSFKGRYVLAGVYSAGANSYGVTPFGIDVKEIVDPATSKLKNGLPPPVFAGANADIIKYRKMWAQYTQGTNLALGRKVVFSKTPDYKLTAKGNTDATDLTDGKLSSRKCDTIWFDPDAVGWYMSGAENGVNCLIDLGEVKPVGDVVIRALAGKAQTNLAAPAEFKVLVSKDGKDYYEAASLVKLMQGEKDLCNFKTHYYIDEMGRAYVFPFRLVVNAETRYVGVYLKGATGAVFSDEIAVMEGNASKTGFNEAYKGQKKKFLTSGILVEPRLEELAISTNVRTPNAFQIADMRDKEDAGKTAVIVVEVPAGITIVSPEAKQESVELNGNSYVRWELPMPPKTKTQTGMIFFGADAAANVNLPACVYAKCDGVEPVKIQVPIKLVTIPEVKPGLKRLHVSLAWMGEGEQTSYPDFFKAWKLMGFNAVGCFPRGWQNADGNKKAEMTAYLDAARQEGFAVVMNESPFHVMEKGHKEGSEIFSQLSSGQKSKNLCPSYKGEFYAKEMERVAQGVSLTKPGYVFWDIECWYPGAKEAPACARCVEEQRQSGKSMDEFLTDCGTEKIKDLKDAVKKGVGNGKMPVVNYYDNHPTALHYSGIMDFNRFYPAYVDTAANSFYVSGNAQQVHDEMRDNHKILKCNKNIPWLTAGTYGKYPPYKLEQMVLEALMNGACGITYFCYADFDTPMSLYHHAKALAAIAPYEDLVMDGQVLLDLEGSNKELAYSAIRKGNEMLLLVGNYKRTPDGSSSITLPFKKITELKDLRGNGKQAQPGNPLRIDVPKDQIVLYYIKGTE